MSQAAPSTETNVRVAVRVRPQSLAEINEGLKQCTSVTANEAQIAIGSDKMFTFDKVFDIETNQREIFDDSVAELVDGLLQGYNSTILAYGQTGSGKTYTMGTAWASEIVLENSGLIPRCVDRLFELIDEAKSEAHHNRSTAPDFKVSAQFLELYNEEINDLLLPAEKIGSKGVIKIHGEGAKIYVSGASTRPVSNVKDCLKCLEIGSLNRVTASTNMNATSSRSHAIFTITVKQQRVLENDTTEKEQIPSLDFETLTAKFHFVDLAGSERLKRTGATGERQKEGIAINCGLLALGNVISALGDATKRGSHVPYRNSKLTRLLQDSLGGNSRTTMIACVSPSDCDFMETLNTLIYANRAKNIKNKPSVNQDKASKLISDLKSRIQELEDELLKYKQGKLTADVCFLNDINDENRLLLKEQDNLREKIKVLQATIESKTGEISSLKVEKDMANLRSGGETSCIDDLVSLYMHEMESVKTKLTEAEIENANYRKQLARSKGDHTANFSTKVSNYDDLLASSFIDIKKYQNETTDLLALAEADLIEKKEHLNNPRSNQKADDLGRGESRKREKLLTSDKSKPQANSPSCDEMSVSECLSEKSGDLKLSLEEDEAAGSGDSDGTSDSDDDLEDDLSSEDKSAADNLIVADIAYITEEISVKEKLIQQLEKSQSALNIMRQGYDKKVAQLMGKLKLLENEKEQQMRNADGSNKTGSDSDKIAKDYQHKVSSLEKEIKKLRSFERVNKKHTSELKRNETRILALKTDVEKMREDKAKLVRQLKEEGKKHRDREQRQKVEVAQLRKQERVKDNKIKALEIENAQKKSILQRKMQELELLRKTNKHGMSDKSAGRAVKSRSESRRATRSGQIMNGTVATARAETASLSRREDNTMSRIAINNRHETSRHQQNKRRTSSGSKVSWENFLTMMENQIESMYSVSYLEKEMSEHIKERERWSREKETVVKKMTAAKQLKDRKVVERLEEELEVVKCSIEETQERIEEKQTAMVALTSTTQSSMLTQLDVESLDSKHCKSLLQQLISFTVEKSVQLREDEAKIRELEAQMGEAEMNKTIQQQLLDFVILEGENELNPTDSRLNAVQDDALNCTFIKDTAETAQLANALNAAQQKVPPPPNEPHQSPTTYRLPITVTMERGSTSRNSNRTVTIDATQQSKSDDLNELGARGDKPTAECETFIVSGTPLMDRFGIQLMSTEDLTVPASPRRNGGLINSSRKSSGDSNSAAGDAENLSRSNSFRLNSSKSSGDADVFKRLLKSVPRVDLEDEDKSEVGAISGYRGAIPGASNFPLKCHHVAEGHKKGVVSVDATEDNLFTGSLDRTVKVWDLNAGSEILSIVGFPHSVLQVRYHTTRNLLFCASLHVIKVLDPLSKQADIASFKTLKSAGGSYERIDYPSAQTTKIPHGEDQINDIAFSFCGNLLYSVARNFIRIWDLRHLSEALSVQLDPSQSHSAAINVVAVKRGQTENSPDLLFTGSRDHSVKCCEAILEGGCRSLEPPHYDGVESLCLYNDWLYSSGRDSCIKQWDVSKVVDGKCENVTSVPNAHNHWITAMAMFPAVQRNRDVHPYLVSGCRSGEMKVWDSTSLKPLGELKAHKAHVHAFATNSSCLFSASGDWDVKIWRL
ncbi:kinesin-like protein KIF21A [Convolutriloba macropyga]|uniref:kinesin-like protein KIF21A n=1 Tax=Convolutriloba macropyga TaxID=536237 RepID=UPI003F51EEDA